MKKLLDNADKVQQNAEKFAQSMKEKGIAITFSSVMMSLFVLMFLVFLGVFLQKVLPNTTTTDELMLMRKEIQIIKNSINENKQLGIEDFRRIAPLRTGASILDIYRRISDIVDNNNIVENISLIETQISIIVNTTVEEGRAYLHTLNFVEGTVEKLSEGTDQLKTIAISEITKAFLETHTNLKAIHKEFEECETDFLKSQVFTAQLIVSFLTRRNSMLQREKHEYYKLKRKIWAIFETIQNNTARHIRNLK